MAIDSALMVAGRISTATNQEVESILRQWAEEIAEEIYSKIEAAEWPYMVDKQPVKDIIAQL